MTAQLSIVESHYRGLIYLALHGDVDLSSIETIRHHVGDRLGRDTTTELVIDLAAVNSIDATGVGVLVSCRDHADDAGVPYRVVNADGWVREVMDRAGVADAAADISTGPVVVDEPEPILTLAPLVINGLSD